MKVDVAALEQGSVHAGGGTDSVTLGTGVGNALFRWDGCKPKSFSCRSKCDANRWHRRKPNANRNRWQLDLQHRERSKRYHQAQGTR
jgi:hypothetical protein